MPSLLEKHYQQELAREVRHFVFHWLMVGWAALVIFNLVALAVVYWTLKEGWLHLVKEEAVEQLLAAPAANLSPLVSEEPADLCSHRCTPQCQDWFNAALATMAGQKKKTGK